MAILPPPLSYLARLRGHQPAFWSLAEETWEVSPGGEQDFPKAIHLPGQIERIEETIFGDMATTLNALTISGPQAMRPTLAGRFKNVQLFDGVLYKKSAEFHLSQRRDFLPLPRQTPSFASGAIYDSWVGLRYFGNWLIDDCETYRLAEAFGQPVSISADPKGHKRDYEALLSMTSLRVQSGHFEELVLFQDLANNGGKISRAADRRKRLLAGVDNVEEHPGVFLTRGKTGDPRILVNEERLAETLSQRYGFRIIHILEHSAESLIKACAGAKMLIGVEGSQLVHALAVMPPGGTMLVMMPPDRVTAAMKLMTDRLGLNFAFVIGKGTTDGFEINPKEIEATLDLLP